MFAHLFFLRLIGIIHYGGDGNEKREGKRKAGMMHHRTMTKKHIDVGEKEKDSRET